MKIQRRSAKLAAMYATVLCCAVVCFSGAVSAQAQEWKDFSYPTDGFRISMPAGPTMSKQTVMSQQSVMNTAAPFELHTYTVHMGPTALYISVCNYGRALVGKPPLTTLQAAENGALANGKAKLLSESNITLGTYPGIAFESESPAGHSSTRIYLVGTTIYQTLITAKSGSPYPNKAKFLDSFQLIPQTTN